MEKVDSRHSRRKSIKSEKTNDSVSEENEDEEYK